MQASYRSYVLLELPFTFTPTVEHSSLQETSCKEVEHLVQQQQQQQQQQQREEEQWKRKVRVNSTTSKEDTREAKRMVTLREYVAAFYDPLQLRLCLHDKTPTEDSLLHNHHHHHHNNRRLEDKISYNTNKSQRTELETDIQGNTRVPSPSSSSSASSSDNEELEQEEQENNNNNNNNNNMQNKEMYLAIGDGSEYCPENIYSGWCNTKKWQEKVNPINNAGNKFVLRNESMITWKQKVYKQQEEEREQQQQQELEKELDELEGPNTLHLKRQDVFPCTTPQLLVHGFYRNDLLIRVHETKRIHRLRDRKTNKIIREWYSEEQEEEQEEEEEECCSLEHNKTTNKSLNKQKDVKTHDSTWTINKPTVDIVGVVSREVQIARPADFVYALAPSTFHSSSSNNNSNISNNNNVINNYSSSNTTDVFPPARFLSEKTPFEVRYEMGKNVNYTVAEHVARLENNLESTTATKETEKGQNNRVTLYNSNINTNDLYTNSYVSNSSNNNNFTDFRQRVESGFVDTLMIAAQSVVIPPRKLLPVQIDFLTQHKCEIISEMSEEVKEQQELEKQNMVMPEERRRRSVEEKGRIGISIKGSLPELMVLNELLEQRPLWITGMLSEAMLYSGVCPRANFNKQLVNCVTYVIATGAFNRLRIRMNVNPFATIRHVIYQRLMIRLLRRSELGMLLRDASRSPYLPSTLAILLQRHKEHINEYKTNMVPDSNTTTTNNNNNNNNTNVSKQYQLTLIEVLCNVVKRGSLYITLQLIDILDDVVIATSVWNHIAPIIKRENKVYESNYNNNNKEDEEEWKKLETISLEQRDFSKENVRLLWRVLRQQPGQRLYNTINQSTRSNRNVEDVKQNELVKENEELHSQEEQQEEQEITDDEEHELIRKNELPLQLRDNPYGWLGQNAYTRITTRFSQALHSFLIDDVMPLLRFFAGTSNSSVEQQQLQHHMQPSVENNNNDNDGDDDNGSNIKTDEEDENERESDNERRHRNKSNYNNDNVSDDVGSVSMHSNNSNSNSSIDVSAPSSREVSSSNEDDNDELNDNYNDDSNL